MSLGFVLVGIVFGVISALAMLLSGAGVALALLAYIGGGLLGVGLGVAVALWLHLPKNTEQAGPARVNAPQNPK